LIALDQLDNLKKGSTQVNINAREAIRFFDRAQSGRGKTLAPGVKMQAPTEQYAAWADAEKHLAPEYLPSVDEQALPLEQEIGGTPIPKDTELSSDTYPTGRPTSSTSSSTSSPKGSRAALASMNPGYKPQRKDLWETDTVTNGHRRSGSASVVGVPHSIQSLLNCVLWRMHNEAFSSDDSGSFLLVTNDLETMSWAQKFDISVKRLDQLDQAIRREEADYKSRLSLFERGKFAGGSQDDEADEHLVLRSRAPNSPKNGTRPPMRIRDDGFTLHNTSSQRTVISPNSFSRGTEHKYPDLNDSFVPRGPMDPDSFGRIPYPLIRPEEDNFVLKSGVPRKASRGKGKLWEP
jgi:hypothetical protein